MRRAVDFYSGARFTWLVVAAVVALSWAAGDELSLRPGRGWAVMTYAFVHTDAVHLVLNLLALITVGAWCERTLGSRPFAVLFVSGAVCGGLCFLAVSSAANSGAWLEGASAGIISVAVGTMLTRRTTLKAGLVQLSSSALVIAIIVILGAGLLGPNPGGAVAHLGGLAAGAACSAAFRRRHLAVKTSAGARALRRARVSGFTALSDTERDNLFNPDMAIKK